MSRNSNGDGSIFYREDRKKWVGVITIGVTEKGTQKRKTFYGDTRREVKEKIKSFEFSNIGLNKELSNTTLNAWFKVWLYELKKPHLKPRSFQRYEGLFKNYISNAPFIEKTLLDIKSSEMEIWYNQLKMSGNSPAQINKINELISSAFEKAINDRAISFNPAKQIKIKVPKSNKINVLSQDEQNILVNYLKDKDDIFSKVVLFALGTGMRIGEILALTWEDYNKNNRTIEVNKNLQRIKQNDNNYIYEITTPKSQASYRTIPLPSKTSSLLDNMKKEAKSNIIFCNENGEYLYVNAPTRYIHKVCKELNITDISMHGLRHSYATRLFEQNIQIKTVQKLMGHSEIETTLNIYTHVMDNIKEEAVDFINDFL